MTAHATPTALADAVPFLRPGTRSAIAIATADELLADGQWHRWDALVPAMAAASTTLPKSASNWLHELVRAGALERRGQHPNRVVRRQGGPAPHQPTKENR